MVIKSAMIMAAGFGTRMMPLTKDMPKPMIKINDISLIEFTMHKLYQAGVRKIVINLHYHADLLKEFVSNLAIANNFKITFSYEETLLEAGGIVKVLENFNEDPFYITNCDNIWLEDGEDLLTRMANFWDSTKMDALLSMQKLQTALGHDSAGDFNLSQNNQIIINEKSNSYIFSGIRIVNKDLFHGKDVTKFHFFRDMLFKNRAINDNIVDRVYGLVHNDLWFDIGNLEGLKIAQNRLKDIKLIG